MSYDELQLLRVTVDHGVARCTIDNPPVNLLDLPLMLELDRFGRAVEADDAVRVVVLDSADDEFFLAHADVELILRLPREAADRPGDELGFFHAMVDRFRTMPKATIAVLEGIARGGGSELALSCDMRFAALGRAVVGQPEVAVGIIPGGSGCQRLPRLLGRARALEAILGCADLDAAEAERWGWVNRALPDDEIRPFVDRLARRIASYPARAIAEAKAAVDAALPDPTAGLREEEWRFSRTLQSDEPIERMQAFLARGGQTRDVERLPTGNLDATAG